MKYPGYHAGSYDSEIFNLTGTISKLIIYGRLFASIDWGIVEEVVFAAGGRGTLVIPVRVNSPVSFGGFTVLSIDLTDGEIEFDLSGLTPAQVGVFLAEEFTFDDVFVGAEVEGTPDSVVATDGFVVVEEFEVNPVTGVISPVPCACGVCKDCDSVPSDAEFLGARTADILRRGLTTQQLHLSANNNAVLTLVLEERSFVLATRVNNRNVSGSIRLPDRSGTLIFDIRGNGSNVREFRVVAQQ